MVVEDCGGCSGGSGNGRLVLRGLTEWLTSGDGHTVLQLRRVVAHGSARASCRLESKAFMTKRDPTRTPSPPAF